MFRLRTLWLPLGNQSECLCLNLEGLENVTATSSPRADKFSSGAASRTQHSMAKLGYHLFFLTVTFIPLTRSFMPEETYSALHLTTSLPTLMTYVAGRALIRNCLSMEYVEYILSTAASSSTFMQLLEQPPQHWKMTI